MLSEKLSQLCYAIAHHAEKGEGLDKVFVVALQNQLEGCLHDARTLESGLVPPISVGVGPVDCGIVAGVSRAFLTGQRGLSLNELQAMACVCVMHEATSCQPRAKKAATS